MDCREYFKTVMTPAAGESITNELLDRLHPNAEEDTFGSILAEMPLDSACGDGCKEAIDNAVLMCMSIREAFGDDLPKLHENVAYAACRVCSCFIRG